MILVIWLLLKEIRLFCKHGKWHFSMYSGFVELDLIYFYSVWKSSFNNALKIKLSIWKWRGSFIIWEVPLSNLTQHLLHSFKRFILRLNEYCLQVCLMKLVLHFEYKFIRLISPISSRFIYSKRNLLYSNSTPNYIFMVWCWRTTLPLL
jgi:hypothetical protein